MNTTVRSCVNIIILVKFFIRFSMLSTRIIHAFFKLKSVICCISLFQQMFRVIAICRYISRQGFSPGATVWSSQHIDRIYHSNVFVSTVKCGGSTRCSAIAQMILATRHTGTVPRQCVSSAERQGGESPLSA